MLWLLRRGVHKLIQGVHTKKVIAKWTIIQIKRNWCWGKPEIISSTEIGSQTSWQQQKEYKNQGWHTLWWTHNLSSRVEERFLRNIVWIFLLHLKCPERCFRVWEWCHLVVALTLSCALVLHTSQHVKFFPGYKTNEACSLGALTCLLIISWYARGIPYLMRVANRKVLATKV